MNEIERATDDESLERVIELGKKTVAVYPKIPSALSTATESVNTPPGLAIVAMIIIGYSAVRVLQVCAYLTAHYPGIRLFGKVFGVMASMLALGIGIDPLIAGAVYYAAESYEPMLIVSIFMSLVGGGLLIGLGPYPEWDPKKREKLNLQRSAPQLDRGP